MSSIEDFRRATAPFAATTSNPGPDQGPPVVAGGDAP